MCYIDEIPGKRRTRWRLYSGRPCDPNKLTWTFESFQQADRFVNDLLHHNHYSYIYTHVWGGGKGRMRPREGCLSGRRGIFLFLCRTIYRHASGKGIANMRESARDYYLLFFLISTHISKKSLYFCTANVVATVNQQIKSVQKSSFIKNLICTVCTFVLLHPISTH